MTTVNNNPETFGSLLQLFRKRVRLTQQQLAEAVGKHRHAISRWEQGEVLPAGKAIVLELARHLHLNAQEARHLLDASLTAPNPFWMVPFLRNPLFTGREEILHALSQYLNASQAVAPTPSAALCGLGGVGKTQIALEYAYRHALEYRAIFWIEAETGERAMSSLQRIAEVLQLPERAETEQRRLIEAVQCWLSTHDQWLLIWDNLEDLSLPALLLPLTRQGAFLFTTRHQATGTLARGIGLLPMKEEEGILFLLRRAKILGMEADEQQMQHLAVGRPIEYAAASQLVRTLAGLPLALDQAGAYMEETGCSLGNYLQHYQQQHSSLLQRRGSLVSYHPQSVTTTFRLSLLQIEREQPAAAELLRACTFLYAESIPDDLFQIGAAHLGPSLAFLGNDPIRFDLMLATLRNLSLVQRQAETHSLSLHRLVQVVLREQMEPIEVCRWCERIICMVNAAFPDGNFVSWTQCERYLAQALACLPLIELLERQPPEAGELLYKIGNYLLGRGRFEEAESLLAQAVKMGECQYGPDQPVLISRLEVQAVVAMRRGKYTCAEASTSRALAIAEQHLGPIHCRVGDLLNSLAEIYYFQGKYEQAEPLFQQALHIQEQVLGLKHSDLAITSNNLAALYREQGKFKQAELLYQQALQIREQTLSEKPSDVAFSLNGLATLYAKQGKYEQAEPLYQRALQIREQVLGSEHPDVTFSLNCLATLYRKQGKYEQAEPLYQRALHIREQHLGLLHPETAQTLYDLGLLWQQQGHLGKALSLIERVLSIYSQSLGDTHPRTLATKRLYAQITREQKGAEEGVAARQCGEKASDLLIRKQISKHLARAAQGPSQASSSINDPLQAFLATCCELDFRAWCYSADLWQAYGHWVEEHEERYALTRGQFIAQLKVHGCRADRTKTARIWRGIALVKSMMTVDDGR